MATDSKCTFQITGWDEKTYAEIGGGAKLTQAEVTQAYSGEIEGTSSIEYLMTYSATGTASFVGIEQVVGSVAGKSGTFIIQHVGSFENDKATSLWSIIAGAGTAELANLRGYGSYVAGHNGTADVIFTYNFETVS